MTLPVLPAFSETACADFVRALTSRRVLLVTHEKPDGDAIGSLFALAVVLRDNGGTVSLLLPDALPRHYAEFVPAFDCITALEAIDWTQFDVLLTLDCARSYRTSIKFAPEFWAHPPVEIAVIDHHLDHEVYAKTTFVCEKSSCAELIFNAVKTAKMTVSTTAATLFYIGLLTDTGAFRFNNTDFSAHRAAGELLNCGAQHEKVINALYYSKPLKQKAFEADVILHNLELFANGRIGVLSVHNSDLEKYGVSLSDMEFLVDEVRSIENVQIAVLLSERPNAVKASLRSKTQQYEVGPVARHFKGGGHGLAAGVTFENQTFEAVKTVLVAQILAQHPALSE